MLTQEDEEGEYVIEYYSYKLSEAEKKYAPTEKEMLAVIKSIRHFRYYIEFNELTIISDHYALQYILNMQVLTGRLARWVLELQPYVNKIKHRAGKHMTVADAISRASIESKNNNALKITEEWFNILINDVKNNPDNYPQYHVENETLWKKLPWERNSYGDDYRKVPSPHEIPKIVSDTHEKLIHAGIRGTVYELRKNYWWPSMKSDIKNVINSCVKCAAIKFPNYNMTPPLGSFRIPHDTMHSLSIDIKGTLPVACSQKYRNIIVVMDLLSRFIWAKRVSTVTTDKIISFLTEIFKNENQIPKVMYHDNGKQFISNDFKKFLHDHNIKSYPTAVFHPQANPVERANRNITEAIRLKIANDPYSQHKWATALKEIIKTINTRYNYVLDTTPYKIHYGKDPVEAEEHPKALNNENHRKLKELAFRRSMLRYFQNKTQFLKRSKHREFYVGDIVMIRTHQLSNAEQNVAGKLFPPFELGKIVGRVEGYAYEVLKLDGRVTKINVKDIKNVEKFLQNKFSNLFKT